MSAAALPVGTEQLALRSGLGYLIINSGTRRFFPTSIYVGVALCVLLAVVADLLLLWLQRRLTPWAEARGR